MGLVTLLLVLTFTALYYSKSPGPKPELLMRVVEKITAHLDRVVLWGLVYGAVAAVLTLLMSYSSVDMLIRLFGNIMIVTMALPFVFDELVEKYREKVNPAIMDEIDKIVEWIKAHEKQVSYAGMVGSVLLFAAIFR